MRLRKLALAVGLAGALSAEMASALGLGEVKLNSDLNEPLDAEIKLLQTRELTDGEILVSLASKDDFRNSGVERIFFLNDLKFKVDLNSPRGPVVKVTSKKPVREPYLNFLIQTQWPNGRILREYTLLMDLPVFSQDTARPVVQQATASARPAPEPKATPAPSVRQPEPPAPQTKQAAKTSPSGSNYGSESYGPVKSSDTLWEIALKVRPDNSFSVQQTMLAIQRLNPEAFIRGNINLLRKGQVLRVPTAQHIRALSARDAISEVAVQNNAWGSDTPVAGPQLDASRPVAQTRTSPEKVEGRLTLAASSPSENSGSGQMGSGGDGSDSEALQNELAISLEELDKANRENRELKDRIDELEDQISTMERLIEVSNQEMRALQLASQQKAEAEELAGSPVVETAVETAPVVEESVEQAEASSAEQAEAPIAASDEQQAQAQPKPEAKKPAPAQTVVTPKPKAGLMDTIMDNIQLVAGGAVALLLAAFLLLRRRKPEEEEVSLESLDSEPLADTDESLVEESSADISEDIDSSDLDDDIESALEDEELDLEDDNVAESETGDAVAEADIYIAYGKFDQAEEMLVKAIDEDGAGVDAHLKLLEVYAESNELDKFDRQYAKVLELGDSGAADRAAELRSHFADAGEFDPSSISSSDEMSANADDALDFDFGELDSVSEADDQTEQGETEESFDFDLDLDDDLDSGSSDQDDGLPDLDFDLDSGVEESDDVSLDSDSSLELESVDLDLGEEETSDDGSIDLDLDLDGSMEPAMEDAGPADGVELSEGFALDVESLDEIDEQGVELDLDLEEGSLELTEEPEETAGLDDISLDLEESSDSDAPESADEEFQSFDLSGDTLEPDVPEDNEESDFDLELDGEGDIDLASLDEDLEALSGELDAGDDSALELDASLDTDLADAELDSLAEAEAEGESESLDSDFDLDLSTDFESDNDLELEESSQEEPETDFDLSLESDLEEEGKDDDLEVADFSADDDLDLSGFESSDLELNAEGLDLDENSLDLDLSEVEEASEEESSDLEELAEDLSAESELDAEVALEDMDLSAEADDLELAEDSVEAEAEGSLDAEGSVETEEPVEASGELEPESSAGDTAEMDVAETEDEVFTQALSDLPDTDDLDFSADALSADGDVVAENELEAELDFLADTDEVSTKLDLARAYIDMGDKEGAKDILEEVVQDGSDEQKQEAEELLSRV
jgi:pilus assembly protein FimV